MLVLPTRTLNAAPADNMCEICHKNEHKYIKNEHYVCFYCWDRMEHIEYENMTDEELQAIRDESLAKLRTKRGRGIINTSNIGFTE